MTVKTRVEMTARQALALGVVLLEGVPKGLDGDNAQALIRNKTGTKWLLCESMLGRLSPEDQARLLEVKIEETEVDLQYERPIGDLIVDGKYDEVGQRHSLEAQPFGRFSMNRARTGKRPVHLLSMKKGVSGWLAIQTAWRYGRPATFQELLHLGIQQPDLQLRGRIFGLGQMIYSERAATFPYFGVLTNYKGSGMMNRRILDVYPLIDTWKNDQFMIIPH
jgi:hypothetical protein